MEEQMKDNHSEESGNVEEVAGNAQEPDKQQDIHEEKPTDEKSGEELEELSQEEMKDIAEPKESRWKRKKKVKHDETEELTKKLEELNDRYLRLSAEFDNYRKRTLKEKTELIKTAGESILLNLLPVMDDFERAIRSFSNASDIIALKEGIDLIHTKFKDYLSRQGVKEIEAIHTEFNTDLHEAITKIPVQDENMKGNVVDIVEKGYFLYDKILRYSKVVIGE